MQINEFLFGDWVLGQTGQIKLLRKVSNWGLGIVSNRVNKAIQESKKII